MSLRQLALITLIACGPVSALAAYAPIVTQIRAMAKAKDDLGARILLRKAMHEKLSTEDWIEVDRILTIRPNVGYDVVIAWGRHSSAQALLNSPENAVINKKLSEADELALKNKFSEAFNIYQDVAKSIKSRNGNKIPRVQAQLYFNVLQQMGRTLYGMKKFDDALEVYGWIPPTYYNARQVMFEKMWTAFRAHRLDRALGAVASQQSAFYSKYLDPESYLIKIYILKKLCRDRELNLTVISIKNYLELLRNKKLSSLEWAKSDLLRLSLANLVYQGSLASNLGVSTAERTAEKKKIRLYLMTKFNDDKGRLIASLEKVLGYASIAASTDQKALAKVSDLPSSDILEKQGNEYWPGANEQWVDEIGSHVFIGDSQCKQK